MGEDVVRTGPGGGVLLAIGRLRLGMIALWLEDQSFRVPGFQGMKGRDLGSEGLIWFNYDLEI